MFDEVVKAVKDSVLTQIVKVRDKEYTSRQVYLPPKEETVGALKVGSLTALVDYLNKGVDGHNSENLLIHVEDESTVKIYEQVETKDGSRQLWIEAEADLAQFKWGVYLSQEEFISALQSLFIHSEDYDTVLQYVSNIVADEEVQISDDGIAQEIILQNGINRKSTKIKNPIELAPIRTFTEIPQPVSPFILRMQKINGLVKTALYEADNGKWENDAREFIKDFLEEHLAVSIPILA